MSKSAAYYRNNKTARDKKKKYDTELNSRPEQVKKRVESKRRRNAAKKRGVNVEGKDYDHASNKLISRKSNRGRRGEGNR